MPIVNMDGSVFLKDWKEAGESLQDKFSNLSRPILRDTPTARHGKGSSKVCAEQFGKLEEKIKEVKTNYIASCKIVEKLRKENERLEKRLNENVAQENRKIKHKKELEFEYKVLSKSKISSDDELLKENTKIRYRALRNMVQVKFLYDQKENNTLNGFVFNKTYNKIMPFSVNLSATSQEEIRVRILDCMEQISGSAFGYITYE